MFDAVIATKNFKASWTLLIQVIYTVKLEAKPPRSSLEILSVTSVVMESILYVWPAVAGGRENLESFQWCYSQTLSFESKLWILQVDRYFINLFSERT